MTFAAALPRLCVGILIATAGCNTKSLQQLDGAGGIGGINPVEAGVLDGGFADGGGGPTDSGSGWTGVDRPALDVPFVGRRSFVVTGDVFTGGGTAAVTSHEFTMTLDAGQRMAVIGVPGGSEYRAVEETATGLRLVGTLVLGVPVSAPCGGSLQYDDLVFTVDASGGMSGTGRGLLTTYDGITATDAAVTMMLRGVPDGEPPTLSLSAGGDLAEPWTPVWLVASEPLTSERMAPVLVSTSGDVITLQATWSVSPSASAFAKPSRLLRFDDEYRVTFEGITDLAGNAPRPAAPPTFKTRAAPPLIAGDGFESVTDATLGGAMVLSGAGAPVLDGTRSLYIPRAASLGPSGRQTQLAVRLPVAPGQKAVRFDYRTVNPAAEANISWVVAGIGGAIQTATPASDVGLPTTPATIDGTEVALAPKMTAVITLPGDVRSDEVVVVRIATQGGRCGGPPPPAVPGVIIDNLRTE